MREIKFRAWDELSRIMIQPEDDYDMKLNGEIGYYKKGCTDWWKKLENVILLQFTGFKDKNGKEIYEGDIFRNRIGIYKVIYEKCCFIGSSIKQEGWYYWEWPTEFFEDCEVIGNIYENPELLEEYRRKNDKKRKIY